MTRPIHHLFTINPKNTTLIELDPIPFPFQRLSISIKSDPNLQANNSFHIKHNNNQGFFQFPYASFFFINTIFLSNLAFSFFSTTMAFKLSHILLFLLLWLSIIVFLFHEYHYHFKAKIYNNKNIILSSDNSLLSSSSSSNNLHHDRKIKRKNEKKENRSMSRKVLAKTKFDFSPFSKNYHHQQHLHPPDPSDTQIDPLYGVEKRRVPTGPNPLHH